MIKKFDFYSDFEGEAELVIRQESANGLSKAIIHIWRGYFDSIINLIEPNSQGMWEGITMDFHLDTGWYDEFPWKCDYVDLFIRQLESVSKDELDDVSKKVLDVLLEVLRDSVISNDNIYFDYY